MLVEVFIKACADGLKDPTLIVVSVQEWKDIINFQAGELFPEIGYEGSATFSAPIDTADYQVNLSGSAYSNLSDVKSVFLIDNNGLKIPYEDWIYNKSVKILDLDPSSSKQGEYDPADYAQFIVVWQGYVPTIARDTASIDLSPPKMALLKKICTKEAIRRVLLDHTKLDRYRTLTGRTNEYALLAMIRDFTTEIEISKRRLVDTHQVKTF